MTRVAYLCSSFGYIPQGKLNLSSQATAMAGGESGIAIVPGESKFSLLLNRIDSDQVSPWKPLNTWLIECSNPHTLGKPGRDIGWMSCGLAKAMVSNTTSLETTHGLVAIV